MKAFQVILPPSNPVPVLVSVPHCGLEFPESVKSAINPGLLPPDDTDFFVHHLYDFVTSLGITMIHANYSRWVVDLNRDPLSQPLYSDGRIITALVPETDFLGNRIYLNQAPDEAEIRRRVEMYYRPYHAELHRLLEQLHENFAHVLLFDAHSIRKRVPSIHAEPFPDLILGDNQMQSAHKEIIDTAWLNIKSSKYTSAHNYPFQGGHITRTFGNPAAKTHALQLEMAKLCYMDDSEKNYHPERAAEMSSYLKSLFQELIHKLEQLNQ